MQTNALSLASGIHKLIADNQTAFGCGTTKGSPMSKTASIDFIPSGNLLGRLMAFIDRLLMASATLSIRNGDLPRFGL